MTVTIEIVIIVDETEAAPAALDTRAAAAEAVTGMTAIDVAATETTATDVEVAETITMTDALQDATDLAALPESLAEALDMTESKVADLLPHTDLT